MPEFNDVSPTRLNTNVSSQNHSASGRMLSIACSPDGKTLYAGSYSNIWMSGDGGQNWQQNWVQPPPSDPASFRFRLNQDLASWCVTDIAAALGWQSEKHIRLIARLALRQYAAIVGFGECGVWTALGNGDGSFQNPNVVIDNFGYQQGWRVDKHPRFLANLTGDGRAGIVGFGDAGVWTALGNGDGTFGEPKFVLANLGYNQSWRVDKHPRFVVDLTGNGHADIVGFGDAGVWTALGNGDGTFGEPKFVLANLGYNQSWRVDKHPRFVVDLTGNGHADIVGFGDAGVWTALGNGDGTFGEPKFVLANLGYNQSWRVDKHPRFVVDLTGNGHADIVGFGDAGVWTALSNGDGTFQNARLALQAYGSSNAAMLNETPRLSADLTGDGCADIIYFGVAGVYTTLNKGDGTFLTDDHFLPNFGYSGTILALTRDDFAAGSHGIWRSTDGGLVWNQVHRFPAGDTVGQLEWALGSDHLVYAAGGSALAISRNAGASFEDIFPWGSGPIKRVNHVAVWQNAPADKAPAVIYALGDGSMFLSFDGGATWMEDLGTLPPNVGAATNPIANGNSAKVFVISPRFPLEVYIAGNGSGAATSPALWRGDYTQFPFGSKKSSWEQVLVPDMGGQDSGNVFLATTQKGRGDLLFYGAQRSRAFVGPLYPASATDWHALDGNVHADLHGILLSPDFEAAIRNGDYQPGHGMVWLLSDGGIYRSTNGGNTFQAADTLKTLSSINVAGVAIHGSPPALSLNTGDNDGFYSIDGGQHWSYQQYGGGDNDCSFADPFRPNTMLVFTPRWDTAGNSVSARQGQTVAVYQAAPGHLADARQGTNQRRAVTGPPLLPSSAPSRSIWNASSGFASRGSRPIVLGLEGQDTPAQGDYVFILFGDSESMLVRTQNILDIVSRDEWVTTATGPGQGAKVFRQGPPLPRQDIGVVQASGGHTATQFYVGGDQTRGLWTWTEGMTDWRQLVPGAGANRAIRFFVDPYRPNLIYILDDSHVKRSLDGGTTWQVDTNLETELTWGNQLAISSNDDVSGLGDHFDLVLTDMQFDPANPRWCFAIGKGGVFMTLDDLNWTMLMRTCAAAAAMRPANCYYDGVTDPADPALYVSFAGRGLMKISKLRSLTLSIVNL